MGSQVTVVAAFVAGLLSFFSPCVIALLPIYAGYLSGATVGLASGTAVDSAETGQSGLAAWWQLFSRALAFVAGFTALFVPLGLSATLVGSFLRANLDIFQKIGGAIMIALGLSMLEVVPEFNLPFLSAVSSKASPRAGYAGSFVMGFAAAAGWTPCVGPILASVLFLAAQNPLSGLVLLLVYSAGLAVPFLTAVVFLRPLLAAFRRSQRLARAVRLVAGALLVVAGVLLFLGLLAPLTLRLQSIF